MRKVALILLLLAVSVAGYTQDKNPPQQFFETLRKLEGKAFEGKVTAGGSAGDAFSGKKLVMHVRKCEENKIYIPFFVGEDRSRTWVLTLEKDRILLKHDHRKSDGSHDEVTMYGGLTVNNGEPNMQMFPADQFTQDLIDYGVFNVWWITVNETTYTYNLQLIGTNRVFTVTFDLTKEVPTPAAPWGWKE